MSNTQSQDFVVVGGGIVGLATAYRLSQQYGDAKITVLEKEPHVAEHQSGRNSGVIHSGIYYRPGSLKATTCRAGKAQMEAFCESHSIPFERCGKVVVAVDESEIVRLESIFQRGQANGVDCRMIDKQELNEREPHARGVAAIHVPETGIADYPGVCRKLVELLRAQGHAVELGQQVLKVHQHTQGMTVETQDRKFETGFLLGCAGLYSDRLARICGLRPNAKIVPFRGEYYKLSKDAKHLCRNLIYPVPDPEFPFLGVHFTRMVDDEVECGPNAVFALAREGYSWSKVNLGELLDSVGYGGFRTLAFKHWNMGLGEVHRSLSKRAFVKALQHLIPDIRSEHLRPCRAGVRAQAIASDGAMIDDFLWVKGERMVHVCNAPSPAATASLEIANQIVAQVGSSL